jgi:hypothetical protein
MTFRIHASKDGHLVQTLTETAGSSVKVAA